MNTQSIFPMMLRALALLVLFFSGQAYGQIEACANEVRIDGNVIAVAPTNDFDGDNILCAMEAARDSGFPTVRLDPGTFTIAHINIDSFTGTLEGTTIASTTVIFDDFSIDCEAMINDGLTPSGIKFSRGEPRVRFMSLVAADPCSTDRAFYMLHFTGQNADGPCGNDVTFGVVDRVDISAASNPNPSLVAIGVFPEGYALGGCKTTLLGTFKFNRSFANDVPFGVLTNIKGAGQVDVNFNEFRNNVSAVFIDNANQITSAQFNDFFVTVAGADTYIGVLLLTDTTGAPNRNRLVVHNNTFNLVSSGNNSVAAAVATLQNEVFANVGTVITDNVIDVGGPASIAISVEDVSGGVVTGNVFRGNNLVGIDLFGAERAVTGWSIVNNNFAQANGALADIILGDGTSQCIVGPQQGALIADDGVDNTVILGADSLTKSLGGDRSALQLNSRAQVLKSRLVNLR